MLETYKVGVTLELTGNVTSGIDALIKQMEAFDRTVKDATEGVDLLGRSLRGLSGSGRGIGSISRAFEKLSATRLGAGLLADMDKAAIAAREMMMSADGMTTAMRENARLAADVAKAMEAAARATSRTSGGPGSGGHGKGFGGHDWMLTGMAASMVSEPLLSTYRSAFSRDASVEHLRQVMLQDDRVTPGKADQAVSGAYAATRTAPGSRVSENLASTLDLKNLTGSLDEAMAMMPAFAKLSTVLQLMDRHGGGTGDSTFAAGKALDILGAMITEHQDAQGHTVREIDPALLQQRLEKLTRVVVGTQGRVDPQNYLGFAKQARTAGMLLSDEFLFEKLPAISMVLGGPRTGTALMSMLQVFQGEKLTGKSFDALAEIGLANPGGHRRERDPRTGRMKEVVDSSAIYDLNTMSTDPEKYMEGAQKRMEAAGIHGTEAQITALMKASQRATIAGIFADLLKDMPAILREQENLRHTSLNSADALAQNDPNAKMMQFEASWDKFLTSLGGAGMTDAIKILDAATSGLNQLSDWARANPGFARAAIDAAGGLGAIAAALGGLSTAIFLFGPALKLLGMGGGTAAGVAAAGAAPEAAGALALASRFLLRRSGLAALLYPNTSIASDEADQLDVLFPNRFRNVVAPPAAAPGQPATSAFGAPVQPVQTVTPIVNMQGTMLIDGRTLGQFFASMLNNPATGPTGPNVRQSAGPFGLPLGPH